MLPRNTCASETSEAQQKSHRTRYVKKPICSHQTECGEAILINIFVLIKMLFDHFSPQSFVTMACLAHKFISQP